MQQPEPLGFEVGAQNSDPVALPPGRLRLATSPRLSGSPMAKTIGMLEVAVLAANAAGSPSRNENSHRSTYKLGRHCRQAVVLAESPFVFDGRGLAFDVA